MNNNDISERVAGFVLTRDIRELSSLTSREVAEFFGLKPGEIIQAFETDQHISLDRFITREKIYRAFFKIERDRKISITELAKEMGFFDTHQFITEFEKNFLIHPARYKELIHMQEPGH